MKQSSETNRVKKYMLYCGLGRDEYLAVRPLIQRRNLAILRITSALAALMGLAFLVINLVMRTGILFPYLVLLAGSGLILALLPTFLRHGGLRWSPILCYGQMILVCAYASLLSVQPANYAIPATSVIVFIALLPQSIDDRPIRMYAVMLLEAAIYLIVSRFDKSPHAYELDIMNTVTFCLVGMTLYAVICSRNVRELHQSVRVERLQQRIISSLAAVMEERDESTGGHIQRTEDYMARLVKRMAPLERYSNLPKDFFRHVVLAAPMHDIGKIRVPDRILNKPGKLTPEEFEIMKQHAVRGADIILRTMDGVEEAEYRDIAYNITRYHHERYDGTGYPDGLKGEAIPLEARMMALADVYDALISERVYKKAFSRSQARAILQEGAGTQFDPELTYLFLECV